jgi:hypothetical protein
MKNVFDPSDENRPLAPLSPPSAAMGEGLGVRAVSRTASVYFQGRTKGVCARMSFRAYVSPVVKGKIGTYVPIFHSTCAKLSLIPP